MKMLRWAACAAALPLAPVVAWAGEPAATPGSSAAALQGRFAAMRDQLGRNVFDRPLRMVSTEGAAGVTGEIHAIVDHPFSTTAGAFGKASQWCDVLILHLNVKYCRPSTDGGDTVIHLRIGRKRDQPLEQAYRVDFVHRVAARGPNYLQVTLDAREGPFGTSDYRIVLEAAPAQDGRSLVRLSYSYAFGIAGRLAMQAYLATAGRDKVGFTVTGRQPDGTPQFIGGTRGVVERNTMRYFLAIEAYLGALSAPAQGRMEKSLRDWFAGSERYPRQLHEIEQGAYLSMKRREHSRQQPG